MKILSFGSTSNINSELIALGCDVTTAGRSGDIVVDFSLNSFELLKNREYLNFDLYLFNSGYLSDINILEREGDDIIKSIKINLLSIVYIIEYLLSNNPKARIIVIGSESAKKGSFDKVYFLSKAAVSKYCKEKYLHHPTQQLIVLSPSTIGDSGMTSSRTDLDRLNAYRQEHPKKRFLYMKEVARIIFDIFSNDSTYLTNVEINLDGGKFSRCKL